MFFVWNYNTNYNEYGERRSKNFLENTVGEVAHGNSADSWKKKINYIPGKYTQLRSDYWCKNIFWDNELF